MYERLSIVVPCFNEEANIEALVSRTWAALDSEQIPAEMVLVDDASTDGTWAAICKQQAADPERLKAVRFESNQGMFAAWQAGLSEASGDLACLMDADLQNQPETLPQMWSAFHATQCHVLQGTRSSIEWDRTARFFSSRGLNSLLNIVFGDRAADNKSGFVMAPTPLLIDILQFERKYRYPQTFIRVAARAKGYQVSELETLFQPRRAGVSFLASTHPLRTYAEVLSDIWRAAGEFARGSNHPMEALHGVSEKAMPVSHPYSGLRRVQLDAYFATMPLHAWLIRPRAKEAYLALQGTQWLEPGELQDLQLWRLRRLLWHAFVHVPHYRQAFTEQGLHPRDIGDLNDLRQLPMLSKDEVSAQLYFNLFSTVHRKKDMHKIATSGSTGKPFVTYADRQQLEMRFANTLRSAEWTGWRVGDRQARLWHQTLGMKQSQVYREKLDAWMMRRTFIPAFEMTEAGLNELAQELNAIKPVLIDGYAESLNFLAAYLERGGSLEFTPHAVMSSAQMLTEGTRDQIERGLGCRVYDKYGAREFSGIAYQCEHGTDHHVLDESYIVEVLKNGQPAAPGETGEVVITDLNNYSVPLIRYRIGDLAVAADNSQPCPCGRGLSRIGAIQGRTQALVHCANGRWLPGTFFAHFFKEYDYMVKFFQVVQTERGRFTLNIVKGPHWTKQSWEDLIAALREYVGDTAIETAYVDSIPLLATGKRTPVVSSVRVDFQSL